MTVQDARRTSAKPDTLARLRLLIALDALLVTRSVSEAAKWLDLSPSAVSRMLMQLRAMFGDELMVRRGRGLVPTAFAERLRLRVRAVAAEASAIVDARDADTTPAGECGAPQPLPVPPLSLDRAPTLEGQPSEAQRQRARDPLTPETTPTRRLARYISVVGAGASSSRPLSTEEAADAFGILFEGAADPVQIGALLVALQVREVSVPELCGMTLAARRQFPPIAARCDVIDWPVYLSPRNRRAPWFLLAARLLAGAGHRVVLHGHAWQNVPFRDSLAALEIPVVPELRAADARLRGAGCIFVPLEVTHPRIAALSDLYRQFEMRSPIQLVLPLLNPLGAAVTMLGAPSHRSRTLHQEAAGLLAWPRMLMVESHRDLAQATPHRLMQMALTTKGIRERHSIAPHTVVQPERPPPALRNAEYLHAVWHGRIRDRGAEAVVIDTAALGLMALGVAPLDFPRARARSLQLWQARQTSTLRQNG